HGIGKRNHLHNAHREHRDRYVAPPGQGHATCDPNTEVLKMLFPTQWGSTAACGGDGARRSLLLPIHSFLRGRGDSSPRSGKMLFPTQWENALPHAVGKYRRLRRGWGSPELANPI